jgi:hypothetical protein
VLWVKVFSLPLQHKTLEVIVKDFIKSILDRIKGGRPAVIKLKPRERNSGNLVPAAVRDRKVWYK